MWYFSGLARFMRAAFSGARCVAVLALAAAPLTPTGASALDLDPDLRLELGYDDNVDQTEHGTGEFVWLIAPGMGVARRSGLTTFQASARRSMRFYSSRSTSFSTANDAASFRAAYAPSTQTSANVDFKFRESRDTFELDRASVLFPSSYRSGLGTANLSLTRLEASGQVEAWDYAGADLSDATTRRFAVTLLPVRTHTTAGLISYHLTELDFNGRRGLSSNVAQLGFRRRHTPAIASQFEFGAAIVDYQDGSPKKTRPAGAARITFYSRGPGQPVVAEAILQRDATTTMTAMLRTRLPIGVATANWETELEAEGGYYTHPLTTRRVSFALVDTVGARATISMEGSYAWTLPFHATGLRADTYRSAITLSVPVRSRVTAQTGYKFVRQLDPNRTVPVNYRRGRVFVALSAGFE